MTAPQVSVVLSVRNGAGDLPRAVASILQQTFTDFELIAINNGSTDGTGEVLDRLNDPRVRVVHQEDMGLAGALNRGIGLARGQYIARQDHDDLALPSRLARQVAFMEANPRCALLGTRAEIRTGDRPAFRFHDHPTGDASLRFELLFNNPFVHSSAMLRKSAVEAAGGYSTDPMRQPPEDYELWSRLARRWEIANLPERLTVYRETAGSMSRTHRPFLDKLVLISAENLAAAVGGSAPSNLHRDIAALTHGAFAMLSPAPDIERMCKTVEEAGARIHARAPDSDVPGRVVERIKSLRRRYWRARYWKVLGPIWPVIALGWRFSGVPRVKQRLNALRRHPDAERSLP